MKTTRRISAIALCFVLLFACLLPASAQESRSIGVRSAAALAMADAGLSYDEYSTKHMIPFLSEVKLKENFNEDMIISSYTIEFTYRGVSFVYDYLADGTLTSKTQESIVPPTQGTSAISDDTAKAIALAYISYPGAYSQAKSWEIKTELEDGRYICEVEFLFDAQSARVSEPNAVYEFEYDIEIDCVTGEIVSASWDDNSNSFSSLFTKFINKIIIFFRQIFGVFA